jgi:predicted O-methyltransferase YrrM
VKRIPQEEIDAAVDVAQQIHGAFRPEECAFLYKLARRKGNLVELGCWMGRSTAVLVQAASIWGATVTSVDAFVTREVFQGCTADTWRGNLTRVGLKPPRLLQMTTDEAAEVFREPISLLFIDAGHSYEEVRADLAHWTPKVKVGGVVALHDVFYERFPGVVRAVQEWWLAAGGLTWGLDPAAPPTDGRRWDIIGRHYHTVALRRVQ